MQDEVVGRLAQVEFSVTYENGATSLLPVTVKGAEACDEDGIGVIENFSARRGKIHSLGPGRYGVYLNPALYTPLMWFLIRWYFVHPKQGVEGYLDVKYFFRNEDESPPQPNTVFPDKTVSEVGGVDEHRHLIAIEIQRRTSQVLLRRFNGSFVAFLLRRNRGPNCPDCWDPQSGRRTRSQCPTCQGTGYKGGYSKPIYGFLYHPNAENALQLTPLGEQKQQRADLAWTTSYPPLNPGDIYVMRDNTRWRVLSPVQNTKLEGHLGAQVVRQIFQSQRIDPDDPAMQIQVDLHRPMDTFVGFMKGDKRTSDSSGVTFQASGLL